MKVVHDSSAIYVNKSAWIERTWILGQNNTPHIAEREPTPINPANRVPQLLSIIDTNDVKY
jgi:hypothetical protein